jgi:mono/diheme cytochrome c family protein
MTRRASFAALCSLLAATLFAQSAPAPAGDDLAAGFLKDVRPVLESHCVRCHGPQKKKGGIDFTRLKDGKAALAERRMWKKALLQVEEHEMPPEGEKPLGPEQAAALLAWLRGAASYVDCAKVTDLDPGPPLIRRLNRTEYNATVRDLTGVNLDVAAEVGMPEEATGTAFDTSANALVLPPALMEKHFAAAELILDRMKPPAGASPREIVKAFARRAYRRPVADDEVDRLMALHQRAAARGDAPDKALRLPLKAILVSPHFLFRVERDRAGQGAYALSGPELATRLSYFLWSTMPDEALLSDAEQGKLADPAVLEAHVKRMLAHPKAKALTANFAAQWLQLRKLEFARPSTEFFPAFNNKLKQAMRDEATTFLDKLREDDRSVLDLLDCDYAWLNGDLAKHYGIPGVEGKDFRRVELKPEWHRGGLVGMGAILALTSHTSRTSPTLRGKWILESIYGTPPPPPPPDAGTIKEQKKGAEPKTFRELMAMHAVQPACASCHRRIDPLGFALENYDAVGAWRENQGGKPLDTAGVLPSGEKFDGLAGLKSVLLRTAPAFERNLIEQMMAYALGRDVQDADECSLREIQAAAAKDGHRYSSLVIGIVKSFPFGHRKNSEAKD